jgi:nucleoside-diphosphate-sugar epimerase
MSVVLVTGAGGFVGSAIVRQLVRNGGTFPDGSEIEHVVALLRPGGSDERLRKLEPGAGWSIEHADVHDRDSLLDPFERLRPRAVVHSALPREAYERDDVGLVGRPLELLIEGLAQTRDCRFLQVGSAWILAAGDRLDESALLEPVNPYGHNKVAEERLLARLAGDRGVPWIVLRLFNLFGAYEDARRLVPTLVANLSRAETVELTQGDQVRDFNDVDVAARAFVNALSAPDDACAGIYHIGSGRGTSVRELALDVASMVGHPELIQFGASTTRDEAVPILVSDPTLATDVLGWEPDLDLRGSVRKTVAWWLARLGLEATKEVPA